MKSTRSVAHARPDTPSRRLDEIQELEALWATPFERAASRPVERPSILRWSGQHRLGLTTAVAWLAFMGVLLGLAPAADPAAAPAWTTNVAGVMLMSLLLAPLGVFNRAFGYGASSAAALCGSSLAVNCFTQAHTGFWPTFQLLGCVALAVVGAVTLWHSRPGRQLASR